jgi:WD40 repeat protein
MHVKCLTLLIVMFVHYCVKGQSQSKELLRLQELTKSYKERAIKAEAVAKTAEIQYLKSLDTEKRFSENLRYLLLANELAFSSSLIADKELAALLALQACNFTINNSGYTFDTKIHHAVFQALNSYKVLPKQLISQDIQALFSDTKTNCVLSLGNDGKIIRLNNEKGEWISREFLNPRIDGSIQCIALNNDATLIAVATAKSTKSNENHLDLINKEGQIKRVEGFVSKIEKIVFSPSGNGFYALCDSGRSIMYSDLTLSKKVIQSSDKILSFDVSNDGTKLIGSSALGNLFVWNTSDYSSISHKIFSDGGFEIIAFTPNNNNLIVGAKQGALSFVSIVDGQTVRSLPSYNSKITEIRFSHSGKMMATSSSDNAIRVWNLINITKWPVVIDKSSVTSFVFSPDDSHIISATDNAVYIWPLQISEMANELCKLVSRNLTQEEWMMYVGELKYEKTCPNNPPFNNR